MRFAQKLEGSFYLLLVIGMSITIGIVSYSLKAQWTLIAVFGVSTLLLILSIRIDYKILSLILILASYINLVKPIFGTRYAPILIDLAIALIFLRVFLNKAISEKNSFLLSPAIEISLLLFFLISLIQLFNPNIPTLQVGLEGFRKTTYQMMAVFLGIYCVKNSLEIEKIGKYISYASVPLLLYGIKQWFFFSPFDQRIIDLNFGGRAIYFLGGSRRVISIFSGPFHFAMFSCFIALFSLYFYLKGKNFLYLVLFVISTAGVFLSMTRSSIVAFIISVLFFLWFAKPEKRRLLKKTSVLFLLLLLIVIMISSQGFLPVVNMLKTLQNVSEDQRFLGRFGGYRNMSEAFTERPIMGYGMGSAGDTLGRFFEEKTHFTSHNLGFKILIETGLLGLGIYIFFFFTWFKKAFSLFKSENTHVRNLSVLIISIVLVLLINGITGSGVEVYPINLYIWFFMGALVKIWWLEKNKQKMIDLTGGKFIEKGVNERV